MCLTIILKTSFSDINRWRRGEDVDWTFHTNLCDQNDLSSDNVVCFCPKLSLFECKFISDGAMAQRIKVAKPVIDLDGDEMTRIIWAWIKEKVETNVMLLLHWIFYFFLNARFLSIFAKLVVFYSLYFRICLEVSVFTYFLTKPVSSMFSLFFHTLMSKLNTSISVYRTVMPPMTRWRLMLRTRFWNTVWASNVQQLLPMKPVLKVNLCLNAWWGLLFADIIVKWFLCQLITIYSAD